MTNLLLFRLKDANLHEFGFSKFKKGMKKSHFTTAFRLISIINEITLPWNYVQYYINR